MLLLRDDHGTDIVGVILQLKVLKPNLESFKAFSKAVRVLNTQESQPDISKPDPVSRLAINETVPFSRSAMDSEAPSLSKPNIDK